MEGATFLREHSRLTRVSDQGPQSRGLMIRAVVGFNVMARAVGAATRLNGLETSTTTEMDVLYTPAINRSGGFSNKETNPIQDPPDKSQRMNIRTSSTSCRTKWIQSRTAPCRSPEGIPSLYTSWPHHAAVVLSATQVINPSLHLCVPLPFARHFSDRHFH